MLYTTRGRRLCSAAMFTRRSNTAKQAHGDAPTRSKDTDRMNRLAALTFSAIFLSAGFAASTGHAQIAPQGKGPVAITSDQLTGHNKDCEAIYSGNAEALQDTSRLRANEMDFYNKKLPNAHPA